MKKRFLPPKRGRKKRPSSLSKQEKLFSEKKKKGDSHYGPRGRGEEPPKGGGKGKRGDA